MFIYLPLVPDLDGVLVEDGTRVDLGTIATLLGRFSTTEDALKVVRFAGHVARREGDVHHRQRRRRRGRGGHHRGRHGRRRDGALEGGGGGPRHVVVEEVRVGAEKRFGYQVSVCRCIRVSFYYQCVSVSV